MHLPRQPECTQLGATPAFLKMQCRCILPRRLTESVCWKRRGSSQHKLGPLPAQTPRRPQPMELPSCSTPRAAAALATVRPPTHVISLAPSTVPSSASAHGASGCASEHVCQLTTGADRLPCFDDVVWVHCCESKDLARRQPQLGADDSAYG